MLRAGVMLGVVAAIGGCKARVLGQCHSSDDCPLGRQCLAGVCAAVCAGDRDCADHEICRDGLCAAARCGDGIRDHGEECDRGQDNADAAACTQVCTIARCGDGHVYAGIDQCDDANAVDSNGCTNDCLRAGACRLGDPPVACTTLQATLLDLAGIGACQLAALSCVDDGDGDPFGVLETVCNDGAFAAEVADNLIDDDCDGTVDEDSACGPDGATRPCFLGLVEAEALGRIPAGSECQAGLQTCSAILQWGPCLGEVRPQRALSGVGWGELPRNNATGECGQCDGLDNDCDGLVDEERSFDYDGDGFTWCGTAILPGGDPRAAIDKTTGVEAAFIDCNDADPQAHPDPFALLLAGLPNPERCGNSLDEDCRCDHGPNIGQPIHGVELNCAAAPATRCDDTGAHLDCAILPRSDPGEPGLCASGVPNVPPNPPAATDPVYYYGYSVSAVTGRKACYVCGAVYGLTCGPSGTCASKSQGCDPCPLPPDDSQLAEARPFCAGERPGTCTGVAGPAWDDLVAADPYGDCADGQLCVEGICCDAACDQPCQACASALTGQPDGVCAPLDQQQADRLPVLLCGDATGCAGSSCACEPGTGLCKVSDAEPCLADADCAGGQCECTDPACAGTLCSAADCPCGFNAEGDTACEGNLNHGVADGGGTCGALTCNGQGACNLPNGAACAADFSCESGHCECTVADCGTRACAPADCLCRFGSAGACTTALNDGADDPEDCVAPSACIAGTCT